MVKKHKKGVVAEYLLHPQPLGDEFGHILKVGDNVKPTDGIRLPDNDLTILKFSPDNTSAYLQRRSSSTPCGWRNNKSLLYCELPRVPPAPDQYTKGWWWRKKE